MPRNNNWQENNIVKALHQKELIQKYGRVLDEISKYDSPDQMIKRSLPMSVLGLIISQFSENEHIALKARTEIINRGLGKPVERTVNIYGDIAHLNERDIDNQIMQLFKKASVPVQLTTGSAKPKSKQRRKPRKSDPLVIEADFTEKVEGTQSSAEAGSPAGSEDQGTA